MLGVPTDVSPQELRRAYRRLVHQHHPDRAPRRDQAEAAARTAAIVAAYRTLSDPGLRRRHDVEAQVPRRGTGEVRTAPRPWGIDLPPRPTHDPVLRRLPPPPPEPRPPAPDATPFAATLPRLATAVVVGLVGLLATVVGGATGLAAVQAGGIVLLGAGVVGSLLSELSRKGDV